jgi:hypothetical protein
MNNQYVVRVPEVGEIFKCMPEEQSCYIKTPDGYVSSVNGQLKYHQCNLSGTKFCICKPDGSLMTGPKYNYPQKVLDLATAFEATGLSDNPLEEAIETTLRLCGVQAWGREDNKIQQREFINYKGHFVAACIAPPYNDKQYQWSCRTHAAIFEPVASGKTSTAKEARTAADNALLWALLGEKA